MTNYKIFQCPRCLTLIYCPQTQKTKRCPKCQKSLMIKRMKILKITNSIQDAILIVQNLKVPPKVKQLIAESAKKSIKSMGKKEKFLDFIHKLQKISLNQIIDEHFFFNEADQAGFSEDWVSKKLVELEKNGLVFRPKKGYIQFIL